MTTESVYLIIAMLLAWGVTGILICMCAPQENEEENRKLLDALQHRDRI